MVRKCFISLKHKQNCPFSGKKNVVWFTTAWAGQQVWWDHSNNQGIDRVSPTNPMLVGNCLEALCMVFMQPNTKSWKDFKLLCSFEVSETQILLLFSKVASAVSVISEQKQNVNFIYFHTLLCEKIKKGNWNSHHLKSGLKPFTLYLM